MPCGNRYRSGPLARLRRGYAELVLDVARKRRLPARGLAAGTYMHARCHDRLSGLLGQRFAAGAVGRTKPCVSRSPNRWGARWPTVRMCSAWGCRTPPAACSWWAARCTATRANGPASSGASPSTRTGALPVRRHRVPADREASIGAVLADYDAAPSLLAARPTSTLRRATRTRIDLALARCATRPIPACSWPAARRPTPERHSSDRSNRRAAVGGDSLHGLFLAADLTRLKGGELLGFD